MDFIKILILAVILVALAFAGFAVTILLRKGGKFPNTHVSGNKHLRKEGITCAQTQDRIEQRKAWEKTNFREVRPVKPNPGKPNPEK